MGYTAEELHQLSIGELEQIFCETCPVELPYGCFKGRHITRLNNPGAKLPLSRVLEFLGFEVAPFGVDFRSNRWFFFSSLIQAGRFAPQVSRSRWRPTDVVSMHYNVSRLPGPMRNFLYDEVKPLSDTLLLGLGGINRELNMGDHFFFTLELMEGTGRPGVASQSA